MGQMGAALWLVNLAAVGTARFNETVSQENKNKVRNKLRKVS